MLTNGIGANDGATQSDFDFTNDSAIDESSDSDEASRLSFDSVKLRRPSVERSECVIEEDAPAPAPAVVLEAPDSEFVELGLGSSKNKKSKKKSKLSAARAVFEEE